MEGIPYMSTEINNMQVDKLNAFLKEAESFRSKLLESCSESRAKSLAITKLDECVMWTLQAIIQD